MALVTSVQGSGIVRFMVRPKRCANLAPSKILSFFLAVFGGVMLYVFVGNWMELSLLA
ncbi:MAG: hypothetical protein GY811_14845 [Myxococcales bacterium]|nr:hypothetical protein [Myxococcales bacterium]